MSQMDLLETILRSCGAVDYLEQFRSQQVDVAVLPLLSDQDLIILGVDDSDIRKKLLYRCSKLLFPTEKILDTTVTKIYAEEVLLHTLNQLNLHHANLSVALSDKVMVGDIKFDKAIECLETCANSLDEELSKFEAKINPKVVKKKRPWLNLVLIGSIPLILFIIVRTCPKN